MSYRLDFTKQAQKDINFHKNSGNKSVVLKIAVLLNELAQHPTIGAGKFEQLKYSLAEAWSRRINKEHRLVYEVFDQFVKILSAKRHYL